MRAVFLDVPQHELDQRHRNGLDMLDEMWEGELHMVPPPSGTHQDIVGELFALIRAECRRRGIGRVRVEAGLHDAARFHDSYRTPDLVFVSNVNVAAFEDRGVVGTADVVIEVRSPGDETYEKFGFYAARNVREIVVIDRDTRHPEVYRLAGKTYFAVAADRDGWVTSDLLGIRFRALGDPVRLCAEPLDAPELGIEV